MRLIPKSTGGRVILAGVLAGLAGGIAWARHDPWPPRAVIDPPGGWALLGFTPDGRSLLIRTRPGAQFEAWDLATGRPRPPEAGPLVAPRAFSADRRRFAGVVELPGGAREVAWGDAATGAIRGRFPAGGTLFRYPTFAPDGRSIRAFAGGQPAGMEVVTWDLATGAETRLPAAFVQLGGLPLAASPDGNLLAFADPGGGVSLRDATTGRPLGRPLGSPALRRDPNVAPMFTPDGRTLVLAGDKGRVEAWDVASGRLARAIDLPFRGMTPLAMNLAPDGRTLAASASEPPPGPACDWVDGIIRRANPAWTRPIATDLVLIDLATGRQIARARGASYAEFSPDGRTVVTAGSDGKLTVRDLPGR